MNFPRKILNRSLYVIFWSRKLLSNVLNVGNNWATGCRVANVCRLLLLCPPSFLVTYDLVPPTRTSQYFRNQPQDALVRVPHRGWLFAPNEISKCALLICRILLSRSRRESYSRRSSWTGGLLSNAILGTARLTVHTLRIHEKQNGTVLSISPSPAERQRGRRAAAAPFASAHVYIRTPHSARGAHMHLPARKHTSAGGRYHVNRTRYRPRCTRDTCGSEVRTRLRRSHANAYAPKVHTTDPLCTHAAWYVLPQRAVSSHNAYARYAGTCFRKVPFEE